MKLGEVTSSYAPRRSYLGQEIWHRYFLVRRRGNRDSSNYIRGSLSCGYRLSASPSYTGCGSDRDLSSGSGHIITSMRTILCPILFLRSVRSAVIGFAASMTSDSISNSLRVVRTYRQVNATRIGNLDAARAVIAADGVLGLFGRGLKTRILTNGLQGIMFTILWKLFLDLYIYAPFLFFPGS